MTIHVRETQGVKEKDREEQTAELIGQKNSEVKIIQRRESKPNSYPERQLR